MIYAVSAAAAALFTVFFWLYLKKAGYFTLTDNTNAHDTAAETDPEPAVKSENIPNEEQASEGENTNDKLDEALLVYNKRQSLMFTGLFFVLALLTNFLVWKYSYEMNEINLTYQPLIFPKMAITHLICACAALTDLKRCRIPNRLIAAGIVSRSLIYVIELFLTGEHFTDILKNDALGFAIGFIMLFVIAVITKGGIGFGDVKLFGVIGLMAGSGGVFAVLFLSLLMSSISSVALMIAKRKTLKSSLPMAPFIYLGLVAVIILGVY